MNLNNIRMSVKLPVSFVVLSLAVALAISAIGYRDFRASLINQQKLLFDTLSTERARIVETWYAKTETELVNTASAQAAVAAVEGLSTTFSLLMEDPERELQQAYITDNPNPVGEKDKLDRAEATIPYNFQHENYHHYYRAMKDRLELYDIFLIDMDGTVVYTVYKEADFATNLETGAFRDSGLAAAFRGARDIGSGETVFIDYSPYAPSAMAPAAFLGTPIVSDAGTTVGVLVFQLPSNIIFSLINNPQGLGATGDITLIGQDGLARSSSRFEGRHEVLSELTLTDSTIEALKSGQHAVRVGATSLAGRDAILVNHPVQIGDQRWVLLAEVDMTEVLLDANTQLLHTAIIMVVAMVIVGAFGWYVSRAFTAPLDQLVGVMTKISKREYDVTIPDADRQDEIGDLSRALTLMVDRLREFDERLTREKEQAQEQKHAVDVLGNGLRRLAHGDFSKPITEAFAAEYEALRVDYNNTIGNLGATIANLMGFAATIAAQIKKMGDDTQELSQRTETQASTLEETAAAIDQITESIGQNTEELRSAERLILETDTQVKAGRDVVEKTTKAMDQIEESADEIGSIIRVVDDIAFQTNLLALNAGVEAARAGDAGRGFAVVAAEVRQLALRSTEAVSQIKALIETSNGNVASGVNLVRETEKVLLEIVRRMEGISTVVSSVTSGASEQSSSISEINAGVNNLDRVTQQNAMMVENSNANARSLLSEADNLKTMLSKFSVADQRNNVVSLSRAAS